MKMICDLRLASISGLDLKSSLLIAVLTIFALPVMAQIEQAPVRADIAAEDFRYGQTIAPYVMGGYSKDWLKQSRCGFLVQPRQYMNEAISDVERGIPARLRVEVKSMLSGGALAKMQQEARQMLESFLAEATKKKGDRVGCEFIEAMVKVTYAKARHDWVTLVGTK